MKRAFNEFKQGQNVQKPTADEPSLKRTKINLDVDHDHTSQTILLQMIVFLQRYYVTTTETNTTYQALFREFIAHKRKHARPALDVVHWNSVTYDKYGALVPQALRIAFCNVLSAFEDPVSIHQKNHANKPLVRRLRLIFSRNKPLVRGAISHDKSDEKERVSRSLQTANKPNPNRSENTKKHYMIKAAARSSATEDDSAPIVSVTSTHKKKKTTQSTRSYSIDQFLQGLYTKEEYSAIYHDNSPNDLFCVCCDILISVIDEKGVKRFHN
eukprot:931055_1